MALAAHDRRQGAEAFALAKKFLGTLARLGGLVPESTQVGGGWLHVAHDASWVEKPLRPHI